MKKKYIALMLGTTLTIFSTAGVGAAPAVSLKAATTVSQTASKETETEKETQAKKEETREVYGEVKEVTEDSLKISVGTLETEASEASNSNQEKTASDDEIVITLDGTEAEVTVGKDVSIVKEAEKKESQSAKKETEKKESESAKAETEKKASESANKDTKQKDAAGTAKETEKIELKDIKTGDIVRISYDKDNKVDTITVLTSAKIQEASTEKETEKANTKKESTKTADTKTEDTKTTEKAK